METHRHITHTHSNTPLTCTHTQTHHSHMYIYRHAVTHTHTAAWITGIYHHIWPFYVVLGMELRFSRLHGWHFTATIGSAWDHDSSTVVKGPHGQKEAFRFRVFACPPSFPHGLQAVVFSFCYRGKSSQCQKLKCPGNPHDIPEQHPGFQNAGREPRSANTKKMCPSTPAV